MVTRPSAKGRRAAGWLALLLPILALPAPPSHAVVLVAPDAGSAAAPAAAVPGVPDLLHGRTVFFTRRIGTETVAFGFTPREVTSRGRLVGDLAYHGASTSGSVEGTIATVRLAGEGGCGRLTLRFEPVALPVSTGRTTLEPVAVDLTRAPSAVGRVAGAVCGGAAELAGWLRGLEAALEGVAPRDGARPPAPWHDGPAERPPGPSD